MSQPLAAFARTAVDIVAEIVLTRAVFSGALLLVEGPSDSQFFKRHVLAGQTQFVICGGKLTVLRSMSLLSARKLDGCIGIVDRDYDDHLGSVPGENVLLTDTHDTETLMLSKRLDTVVWELGDAAKLANFQADNACSIESALLARSERFSRLRFLNDVRPSFRRSTEGFRPWKYFDVTTWSVKEPELRADFAALCGVSLNDLQSHEAAIPPLNSWSEVNGHDALAILCIGLRQVLGAGKQVSEDSLCSSLRLAFTEYDFMQTRLYYSLRQWEGSAGGRPLLAS